MLPAFLQQVKCMLVLHLISAAFATAALGLMSKHLPYRQDSYHCEYCRRLELHAVVIRFDIRMAHIRSVLIGLYFNEMNWLIIQK